MPLEGGLEIAGGRFRKCKVTIEIGFDELARFLGARFLEAETENGVQALAFLGYCLNNEGPDVPITVINPADIYIRKTIPKVHQPLRDINFTLEEAISPEGMRCLAFTTGVIHPELMWREMYHGYIEELY